MNEFLRALRVIAGNTIRELVRNKLLYNLLFFAVLLIGSSMFVAQLTIGQNRKQAPSPRTSVEEELVRQQIGHHRNAGLFAQQTDEQ